MGENFPYIDIFILGLIALFLIFRLRGVLGQRHGQENVRPNPYAFKPSPMAEKTAPKPREPETLDATFEEIPQSLSAGLANIRKADPDFEENQFLRGAREAFKIIITAFAKGDMDALRPLLSKEVYEGFDNIVKERLSSGKVQELTLVRIVDVDFKKAELKGTVAKITTEITSQQINVTRNAQGEVIEGHPSRIEEVTDIWTFSRDTRSPDPNWTLVATGG